MAIDAIGSSKVVVSVFCQVIDKSGLIFPTKLLLAKMEVERWKPFSSPDIGKDMNFRWKDFLRSQFCDEEAPVKN